MYENKKTPQPNTISGNNEKTASKLFTILSGSLIAAAVILILIHLIFKLTYEQMPVGGELLLHLGMACLISGILMFSVERITASFHLRMSDKRLRDISYNVFSAIFGTFIPEEINREVLNFVYQADIYYMDYRLDMTGTEVEIEGENLLEFAVSTMMEVHNATNRVVKYVTPIKAINIDADSKVPPVKFRRLEILDNKRRLIKELGESGFQTKGYVRQIDERHEIGLNVESEIEPRDFIFVRVYRTVYLRREKDWYNSAVVKPTINMTLTAQFPKEKYIYWVSAQRPASIPDYPDRFGISCLAPDKIEVKMLGGILPYQSLTLAYKRKVEA